MWEHVCNLLQVGKLQTCWQVTNVPHHSVRRLEALISSSDRRVPEGPEFRRGIGRVPYPTRQSLSEIGGCRAKEAGSAARTPDGALGRMMVPISQEPCGRAPGRTPPDPTTRVPPGGTPRVGRCAAS